MKTGQRFLIAIILGRTMDYSFDSTDLIKELSADIAEDGNVDVWAYWIVMDNGQEIYFDYYPLDDPESADDPEYKSVADFDNKVAETYPNFFRKKIKAMDLLEIFKKENETI